jgi:hypothetical protein
MHKLVVVHLEPMPDTTVDVLLDGYTKEGWTIVSVAAAGAGEDNWNRSYLVAVVLTDEPDASGSPPGK